MFILGLFTLVFFATLIIYLPKKLVMLMAGSPLIGHGVIHFIAISSIGFGTDTRTALTVLVGAIGSLTLFLYGKFVGTARIERGKVIYRAGDWRI